MHTVRFAVRNLRRSPGFAAAALATLALGTGAVTAVVTIVNAVLLRPLPYEDPDRIVFLRGELRRGTPTAYPLGYLDIEALSGRRDVFEAVSPVTGVRSFNLAVRGEVEHVDGEMIGAEYFSVFGVPLALGRTFTADECRAPGARAAIISHDLWRRRFGGDRAVLGSTIALNDRSFEIVGVAAPGFRGVTDEARLWLPIGTAHALYGPHYIEMRQFRWLSAIGRARAGVPLEQARAAVHASAAALEAAWPKENAHLGVTTEPLADAIFGEIRAPLAALLGAAAFVLLIGCLNVANLLLARGSSRSREMAVRLALGATRGALVRQLLVESAVLVALGAAGGVFIAMALVPALASAASAEVASFVRFRIDTMVLTAVLFVAAGSALIFGLAPAVAASGVSPVDGLRESGRSATGGVRHRRFQAALVTIEVTLSLALLAGAGLMTKGFSRHLAADLGFDPAHVITARLDLTAEKYRDNARFWQVIRDAHDRVAALPGVSSVAIEGPGFPTGGFYGISFRHEASAPEDPDVTGLRHHVTPGYFSALGMRLLAGRDFDSADGQRAPRVLVVSESFARRYWPGRSAVGQRLAAVSASPFTLTVVGVVADMKHAGFEAGGLDDPDVYLSAYQFPPRTPPVLTVMARTAGDPAALAGALQAALRLAAPDLPPYDVMTMDARLARQTARGRYAVVVMTAFATLALTLAAVGLYGLVSYGVAQRTREIAIRIALGASRRSVVWLVARHAAAPVAVGIVLGLGAVVLMGRAIASLSYGLDPLDPWILGGTAATIAAIGAAASYGPARRAATQIDTQSV